MKKGQPSTTFLKDYREPDYWISEVELRIDLADQATRVRSRLHIRRNTNSPPGTPLVLDGQELRLLSLRLEDKILCAEDYQSDDNYLSISKVPEVFVLECITECDPAKNTALEGLYKSSGLFCTQCEAEGFRKITYYLDRPDVMAKFTTTLVADQITCPVLLSNGNPEAHGTTPDGKHWVTWKDPFPKPSYLFALVAGDLRYIEDAYTTLSGRPLTLRIFVEPENIDYCSHAMQSLKKAMHWDEQTFGLEYDLDIYMIVAVSAFNMGAMENKGLNVFNAKYILARPETATDDDYEAIEGVVAHEYFHNWTGNRVTCRDWFQLSLKEGLTVYRDQEFSADLNSRAVMRIKDVRLLRSSQFSEDAGPMAHPVRPAAYVEINNFYTATVYNKGAEVVRLYQTLLGTAGFRKGMDLYIQRHDGQAVTVDEFFSAMTDANQDLLDGFMHWYNQAGTPELTVTSHYDPSNQQLSLVLSQFCADTPGQSNKHPYLIPVRLGLLDPQGKPLPLHLQGDRSIGGQSECVLRLVQSQQTFVFEQVQKPPVISVLRDFSAPVKLKFVRPEEELAFLLAHDQDAFNRWEAGQELASLLVLRIVDSLANQLSPVLDSPLLAALPQVLAAYAVNPALTAEILVLPNERILAERMPVIDVDGIHNARELLIKTIALRCYSSFYAIYQHFSQVQEYSLDAQAVGGRRLKNICLAYLMATGKAEIAALCYTQFSQATNMTDCVAALDALVDQDNEWRSLALTEFYAKWHKNPLVMDKWLAVQARSHLHNTLERVLELTDDPVFQMTNPNKVRALLGVFCHGNPTQFHRADGQGYALLSDYVIRLNAINPQVAASLLSALTRWRRYDPLRQEYMKSALQRVVETPGLSKDCYEIATKSLA